MLSKTELNQISKLISKMEGEDFRTVSMLFKEAQSCRQSAAASKFLVGHKVSFNSRRGPVTGVVQKVNRKTIKVKSDDAVWTVSPSLLQHA